MNQNNTINLLLGVLATGLMIAAPAMAEPSVNDLKSCEQSIRGEIFIFNHIIKKADTLVIRKYRHSVPANKLALDLNLFHKDQAYKLELPMTDKGDVLTLPHTVTTVLPDGKYCVQYKANLVLDDEIKVFEKMPSAHCTDQTPEVTAVKSKESMALFRTKILERMKLQIERINSYTEVIRNSRDEDRVKKAWEHLNITLESLKSWDKTQCLNLKDNEISKVIRDIQLKVTAISPNHGTPSAQPSSAGKQKTEVGVVN